MSAPDPTFLGLNAIEWTAFATVLMAVAAGVSAWVAIVVMKAQDRVTDIQTRLAELQERNNWLTGALESQSTWMLRLRGEELNKRMIWWDPTHDGPQKKAPPNNAAHLQPVDNEVVYLYMPPEKRRFPAID
jgi:hypothetical protein